MRLNPDCMRDVLLEMEKAEYSQSISPSAIYQELSKYPKDEIDYSILKLNEAGFIKASIKTYVRSSQSIISLDDITYSGHQFLANIREDNVWNGVKGIAKKIGSTSVDALTQIASSVITELIKAQFGLSNV